MGQFEQDLMGPGYSRSPMQGQAGQSMGQRLLGSKSQTNMNTQPTSMGAPAASVTPEARYDQYKPEAVVSPQAAMQRNMEFQGNPKFVNNRKAVANADFRDTMNQAGREGITYKGNPAYQGVVNNYLDRMAPGRMDPIPEAGGQVQAAPQVAPQEYDEAAARRRLGSSEIMVGG